MPTPPRASASEAGDDRAPPVRSRRAGADRPGRRSGLELLAPGGSSDSLGRRLEALRRPGLRPRVSLAVRPGRFYWPTGSESPAALFTASFENSQAGATQK